MLRSITNKITNKENSLVKKRTRSAGKENTLQNKKRKLSKKGSKKSKDLSYSKNAEKPKKKPKKTAAQLANLQQSIKAMRTKPVKKITNEKGDVVKPKAGVLFAKRFLEKLSKKHNEAQIEKVFVQQMSQSPSIEHRPIADVIMDSNQMIIAALTPQKTRLPLTDTLFDDSCYVFSQQSASSIATPSSSVPVYAATPIRELKNPEHFMQSSPFANVKINSSAPHQEILITPELLQEAEEQIRKNGGRRIISQHKAVIKPGIDPKHASATKYAEAAETFPEGLKWEWLHFIAHKILADKSQDEKNLGCGTYHANTEMLFVEYQIPELAKVYPNGFYLRVEPEFIPNSQLLTKIRYTVLTDDLNLTFVFNAQTTKKPSILGFEYTGALIATAIKLRNGAIISPVKATDHPNKLFFSPRARQEVIDSSEEESPLIPMRLSFGNAMDTSS